MPGQWHQYTLVFDIVTKITKIILNGTNVVYDGYHDMTFTANPKISRIWVGKSRCQLIVKCLEKCIEFPGTWAGIFPSGAGTTRHVAQTSMLTRALSTTEVNEWFTESQTCGIEA